ncbi:MAG TPA: hypothetical protein VHO95_08100, partial [Candidatus Dormibacteraeota bacterium]|nr:hypothetical protein [Candidatus Dormibacteraeota bacterium]
RREHEIVVGSDGGHELLRSYSEKPLRLEPQDLPAVGRREGGKLHALCQEARQIQGNGDASHGAELSQGRDNVAWIFVVALDFQCARALPRPSLDANRANRSCGQLDA